MTSTPVNTQPASTQPIDAYDDAMSPQPVSLERTYFGEVTIVDVWHCILEKGIGKRAFDAGRDDPAQRRTAIKLQIGVDKRDGGQYTVDQDVISTSKEWTSFTLPSLRTLQLDLRTLRGRFVQVTRKPIGETYTNKSGEVKEKTALVFEQVFPDAAACKTAADAFYSRHGNGASGASPQHTAAPAQTQPVNGPSPAEQQEREFAKNSLQILWQASGQNKDAFLAMVAANPMITKYFSVDSHEVQEIYEPLPF